MDNILSSEIKKLIGGIPWVLYIFKGDSNPTLYDPKTRKYYNPNGILLQITKNLTSLIPNLISYRLHLFESLNYQIKEINTDPYILDEITIDQYVLDQYALDEFISLYGTIDLTNEFILKILGFSAFSTLRLFIRPDDEPSPTRRRI